MHKDEKDNRIFAYPFGPCFCIPGSVPCSGLPDGKKRAYGSASSCFKNRKHRLCLLEAVPGVSYFKILRGGAIRFPGIFRHVLEFREDHIRSTCRRASCRNACGLGFAKFDFPGKKGLFTLYIALMMMPFQVMLLGNYLVLDDLRLLDSLLGIIFPAVFSTFPVFIMYRFFEGIPLALLEAARLDGAGELRLFFMIAIPLGSPGVISAMVLGFLEYWNLIEQPMVFLKTKELWPLSLYLPNIDMDHAGTAFAASMVALIPAVLVFFAGQDYLEQGIVSTAVKE